MIQVPLSQGLVALIDDEDAEAVLRYKWCATRSSEIGAHYYAYAKVDDKMTFMHRFLMKPGPGLQVDHINGDGLCNIRSNLRIATRQQQQYNKRSRRISTSRFKGVHWLTARNCWKACIIRSVRKLSFIGHFQSEVDAAFAYDMEALDTFGEFAQPNFIESVELYREIRRLPHPGIVCFGSIKGLE